ncbi:guanine nucleotide exchange factor C9orf72-like [Myxocyprinus asiaticus]|uniref:guanine nucleotide exchange factor C9orf72-like n=1 Tax=Myxocyprinus asiaticus TaxID=70543 RepID=UPI0022220D0D|nr:guanine nucleotide exchange factor C9orf72-like [Myxocyprinus asiaticus]
MLRSKVHLNSGETLSYDVLHSYEQTEKAFSSHLQTCGCSMVVGSNPKKDNKDVMHKNTLVKSFINEAEGEESFQISTQSKNLTVEGDLNIIMVMAEKLRAGLHSFVFGKSFLTSVQERDLLMSF